MSVKTTLVKTIDLTGVTSLSEAYARLDAVLEFPKHFSYNLDSLYDILSTDIKNSVHIVWDRANIGISDSGVFVDGSSIHRNDACLGMCADDQNRLISVFEEVQKQRKDFSLTIL